VDLIFGREPPPYLVSVSDIRVIMVIMRVLMVELLCQVVTGQIPALECLLPSAREHQWLCLILYSIKWPRYSRTPALGPLAWNLGYPRAWLSGVRVHVKSGCEDKLD
jgi:hypothetical protein